MNEELISVIIPVFNVELYLERCLKSIIRQDYYNIEIVLVDDGSTDGSGKICDLYACKDTRIKVIHKKNGGLSDARNKGLDVATGEYISFIDSDDWIEYSMYSQLMNELQKNNADIIICGRYRAYNNGKKRVEKYRKYPINNLMSTEEALGNLMTFTGFDMSFCDKIFKKSLFDGICFPFAKTCEDSYVMYQIIAKAQRIYYYEKPFYNYFYREGSITRNNKVNETIIEAMRFQLEFIEQRYPQLINDAIVSYVISFLSVYNEYIKRNQKWEKVLLYRNIARKELKKIFSNHRLSILKKAQITIFALSSNLYRIIIKK